MFVLLIWNRIEYYNLIFAVFHLWPLQLLINNPVFYYNICCFSTEIQMNYFILRSSRFWGLNLTFDPYRSHEVKNIFAIRKPIHDFLSNFCWHFLSISYGFRYIRLQSFSGFDLDLWPLKITGGRKYFCHSKAPYMTSYLTSIDTFSLSRTVFEIFDFKVFRVWPWPWPLEVTRGRKKFHHSKAQYMTSYLTSIDTFYLVPFSRYSTSKFQVWPWPLTFRGPPEVQKISPFESPYMTSYLTSIDTFSLSRTVFDIFDFKFFKVWPWPLTFRGHQRSKIFLPSKAHTWLPI